MYKLKHTSLALLQNVLFQVKSLLLTENSMMFILRLLANSGDCTWRPPPGHAKLFEILWKKHQAEINGAR